MKAAIKKIDFDEAVKRPWDSRTCLLAQAGNRLGKPLYLGVDGWRDYSTWPVTGPIYALQRIFDEKFRLPGDEKKPELQALRASLPIEIELP